MSFALTNIVIYPVKSCRGIPLRSARAEERGLRRDRCWMLVDEASCFLSQRSHPRLALVDVVLADDQVKLSAPSLSDILLPAAGGETLEVRVWQDSVTAARVSPAADTWLSDFLQTPCRLVYLPDAVRRPVDPTYARGDEHVSFADGFPYLLCAEESLADLNARLSASGATPLTMDRFRPNLVVGGSEAYAEDGWQKLRIGAVTFRVVKPCARCIVTTVDQRTGERGEEPLRTLAGYRRRDDDRVLFGMNLVAENEGELSVGDAVEILGQ